MESPFNNGGKRIRVPLRDMRGSKLRVFDMRLDLTSNAATKQKGLFYIFFEKLRSLSRFTAS